MEHKDSGSKKDIPDRSGGEAEVEKSISVRDIDLQEVEGMGPATSKKLKEVDHYNKETPTRVFIAIT